MAVLNRLDSSLLHSDEDMQDGDTPPLIRVTHVSFARAARRRRAVRGGHPTCGASCDGIFGGESYDASQDDARWTLSAAAIGVAAEDAGAGGDDSSVAAEDTPAADNTGGTCSQQGGSTTPLVDISGEQEGTFALRTCSASASAAARALRRDRALPAVLR